MRSIQLDVHPPQYSIYTVSIYVYSILSEQTLSFDNANNTTQKISKINNNNESQSSTAEWVVL